MPLREVELKFILLGTINAGKTSLVERLRFGPDERIMAYSSTIGVDFCIINKFKDHCEETQYRICLWDAGGHTAFMNVVRSFFNKVTGAIVLYDVNSLESFQKAKEYIKEYKKFNDYYSYIFLLGNKIDLDNRVIEAQDGKEYADSIGAMFKECSVKENINIDDIFDMLLEKINTDILEEKLVPSFNNGVKIFHKNNKVLSSSSIVDLNKKPDNKCCIIM